jgi:hypothetical protein
MKSPLIAILTACTLFAFGCFTKAIAQMVPDSQLVGQAPDLGLDRAHMSKVFTVQQTEAPGGVNVIWPGETEAVTLTITNTTGQPIQGDGHVQVIHYAVHGRPGDGWLGQFIKLGDVQSIPISVNVPAHGSSPIQITPTIPETFGGYALIVDLGTYGQRFGCAIARTLPADAGRVRIPAYALDIQQASPETFYLFKRLGVKGARMEMGATLPNDPKLADKTQALDVLMKMMWDNEVTTMLTVSTTTFPQPLGIPRPFLDDDAVMQETKSDMCSLPANDPDFQTWTKMISDKYGWPGGPINAMELWNEPWEGISISGWGADMLRYRALYTAMAQGIVASRKEGKTDVLIGGTCSSSNTMDKLFPDGDNTFLKWLDFSSLHYQPFAALSALDKDWVNRKSPEGPVQAWDTESWIANSDDRTGIAVAAMHSMGQQRAMGIFAGNVYSPEAVVVDHKRKFIIQAWSTAAAVAASQKFIGQRKFQQLLFKNGLPWILVFAGLEKAGGKANPDDGTVVVVGDFSSVFDRNLLLFRDVYGLKNVDSVIALKKQLAAATTAADAKTLTQQLAGAMVMDGGTLTLGDGSGKFGMKDFYGNDVASANGKIAVPLDGLGYFLRTDGSPGSFAALLAELRKSRIDGYEPISVQFHDFNERIAGHPTLHLTVTNILNRPITGKLHLDVDHLQMAADQTVSLGANETQEVQVPIQGGTEVPNNTYAARLTFDAGADGHAVDEDNLHVNVIARRTITVDGKLDDWKDVLPQPVAGAGISANLTEKAWLPFEKYDDSVKSGVATGYLAYDNKNFYFAARIADTTPEPGMVRTATRDDDAYFYPEKSYQIDPTTAVGKKEFDMADRRPDLGISGLQLPDGPATARSTKVWQSYVKTLEFDVAMPASETHQVSLYFVDPDALNRSKSTLDVVDADSGKVLDTQKIADTLDGKYLVYQISGHVKLRLTTTISWIHASVAGLFFDPASSATPASGTSATFVSTDDKTRGDWKGVYGKDGYLVIGAPDKYPAYAKVTVPEVLDKKELDWPAGVPRYSYRKKGDLPAGDHHDNVQIAFNVLPNEDKPFLMYPAGTMPKYEVYPDSDYEYALNPVAAEYGGGTEVWRLNCPGMPHKHFFPRQPKSKFDGAVKDAQLVVNRDGNTRTVEAAIPWSEIPEVKKRLDAGETIKFSFRVNDNNGPAYELATDRSVSKINFLAFHNDFATHWANELEFKFEK